MPWASPYAGAAHSYLANFNSENTQNGVADPGDATHDYSDLTYGSIAKNVWVPSFTIFNVMAGYQRIRRGTSDLNLFCNREGSGDLYASPFCSRSGRMNGSMLR